MVWMDGGIRPSHPDIITDEDDIGENGVLMIGENGLIWSDLIRFQIGLDKLDLFEKFKRLDISL